MSNKRLSGLLLAASMLITSVVPVFAVSTDKTTEYNFGDEITITRESSVPASLEITSEDGTKVLWDSFKAYEKEITFKIPEADNTYGWTEGKYTVVTGTETTTFVIKAPKISFRSWNSAESTIYVDGTITLMPTFNNLPSDATIEYSKTDSYVNIEPSSDRKSVVVRGIGVGTSRITATAIDKEGNELASGTATVSVVRNNISYNGGSGSKSSKSSSSVGGIGIFARPDAYEATFTDMGDAAWAENAVNFLAKKGIVSGYDSTTFAPNESVTRAEFAKLISTLYNLVTPQSSFGAPSFFDVAKSEWYFNYVEVCAQLGIVNGYEDGNFYPNKIISRQEMAAIIYRTTKLMGTTLTATQAEKTFDDADQIDNYAKQAVSALQSAGIISGTSDTAFEPKAGCTRAQAATIIYNMYIKYVK